MKSFFLLIVISLVGFNPEATAQNNQNIKPKENYVLLLSGEKIENISTKEWKYFDKKNKLKFTDRTIPIDSIASYNDGKDFYLVLENGYSARQFIWGKIDAFSEAHFVIGRGGSTPYTERNYYVKKGDGKLMFMNIPLLKELMADNTEALKKLNELEKKIIRRLKNSEQIDILNFYNAN